MRLSDFILKNLQCILEDWEAFAETLTPADQKLDSVTLLDHAKKMLETIAADLAQPETEHQELQKSKGQNNCPDDKSTAATIHGIERLALGFSLDAAVAEYRALRANVTRLWQKSLAGKPLPDTAITDLIRFNEAIDQAINESVTSYSFEKEQQMRVFDTILSSSPDLSFTFDLDGKFAYANKALTELFELPLNKILGKTHCDLDLPNAAELHRSIRQVISTRKQFRGEISYPIPSGKIIYDYILVPALDKAGEVEAVAGIARDITERKAAEELNWGRANYDLLTGLPNRRLFLDRLEQDVKYAARAGTRTALLFIDLDNFKNVNDSFGHDAGDFLLRLVTERLRSCVRGTDIIARLGGDEFTVILHDLANAEHIEFVAGKILKELANPFLVFKDTVNISASIGIALSPEDASTPEQLLKNADQAMYASKNNGRNQFTFYSPSLEQSIDMKLFAKRSEQPNDLSGNHHGA